jgi:hypothetical protein
MVIEKSPLQVAGVIAVEPEVAKPHHVIYAISVGLGINNRKMKIFILDPPLPLEKVILVNIQVHGCPKMDGVKKRPRVDKVMAVVNLPPPEAVA